jgi:hypothetical protein
MNKRTIREKIEALGIQYDDHDRAVHEALDRLAVTPEPRAASPSSEAMCPCGDRSCVGTHGVHDTEMQPAPPSSHTARMTKLGSIIDALHHDDASPPTANAKGGIDIEWLGGNCPVQAEGTFDGVPFYFRARGTGVTVDVGEDWTWCGPEYEWPHAGGISPDTARAFIGEAYDDWTRRADPARTTMRETRRRNDNTEKAWTYIAVAADMERAGVEGCEQAIKWLMDQASDYRAREGR